MRRTNIGMIIALTLTLMAAGSASAIRIKDMASVQGVRGNHLIGYGLVVGLNGTGDGNGTGFTNQGLSNMLTRMGVRITSGQLKTKNVAAVMVTTDLPPFSRAGTRIDVTLSSLGDATSLAGGTLLMTPMKAIDGQVYVVAQGPVSVGGFQATGEAASVSKNFPTAGRIPRGGTVEREVPHRFADLQTLTVNLDTPDFTTAMRVADRIASKMAHLSPQALDPSTVRITMPANVTPNQAVTLLAQMENLEVEPDVSAKVIVDERTGTVVMGENVRISTVAVASGALSISITNNQEVSQALPFAEGGKTVISPETNIQVSEGKKALQVVKAGVSIGDVVKALNALGATPRDLIVILQAIKVAGALQAELEII